jgi:nucleoside-diphosphate-sugar epimerase
MTAKIIFLAGASGAIGKRLVPQLVDAGYVVFGTTRSSERARAVGNLGATPIVVDVFDHSQLTKVLCELRPDVVMNQLTDLPKTLTGPLSEQVVQANSRLRDLGTRSLIDAALVAGVHRFIAQSLAWIYAPGPTPHGEDDPLENNATGTAAITNAGVIAAERMTLNSPPLEGVVLRYGQFYGPDTWNTAQNGMVPVHVDAAAHAALLAIETPHIGIFNIAEEKGLISAEKARRELGWSPDFRMHPRAAA